MDTTNTSSPPLFEGSSSFVSRHHHEEDKKRTKLKDEEEEEENTIMITTNQSSSNTNPMTTIPQVLEVTGVNQQQQQQNSSVADSSLPSSSSPTTLTRNYSSSNQLQVKYLTHLNTKNWQVDFNNFALVDTSNIQNKELLEFYEKQNEMVDEYAKLYKTKLESRNTEEAETQDNEEGNETGGTTHFEVSSDGDDSIKRRNPVQSPQFGNEEHMFETEETVSPAMKKLENICIHLSFWVNVCLFLLKCSASLLSVSLSVITSAIDSALDLLSGLIIYITSIIRKKKNNIYQYPIGRNRLEPLGFVIFATCMCTASLQIIKEGLTQIVTGLITGEPYLIRDDSSGNANVEWMFGIMISQRVSTIFYYYGLGVLLLTITVKFILFLICRQVKHSPSVIAYAFDHRNDVLSNTVLVISVFLSKMLWWFDSLGATILSVYIIKSWIEESMEHITKLVGLAADSEYHQKLTFIALNHSPLITKVDTVLAYYSGSNIIVEIDIVLPEDTPLKESHDVGESLQKKIESLPDVERCYVHMDYEYDHRKDYEHVIKDE
ncbi:hypothetical protein C9374_008291 [Naegleria lovaniensis]|uniref:Uncharacterized protein n=1 Tax=Naegleria lovaniensis TaxID=51637 RepID=A0AA88GFS7_NAELO|nr:uncharacterized protein C9374_008291 [Naegleria lovaniensis]KAG2378652.1 hypothetical protein C9374_008291 [Naegleria lovaniensis]